MALFYVLLSDDFTFQNEMKSFHTKSLAVLSITAITPGANCMLSLIDLAFKTQLLCSQHA